MITVHHQYHPQIMYKKNASVGTWNSAGVFNARDGHFSIYTEDIKEAKKAIERELECNENAIEGRQIIKTRILARTVTDWEEVAS